MVMVSMSLYSEPFAKLKASLGEPSADGYSMESLRRQAESCGCYTLVATSQELARKGLPRNCLAIVHEKPNHFQIVRSANASLFSVFDTKRGEQQMMTKNFIEAYSQTCLLISSGQTSVPGTL